MNTRIYVQLVAALDQYEYNLKNMRNFNETYNTDICSNDMISMQENIGQLKAFIELIKVKFPVSLARNKLL